MSEKKENRKMDEIDVAYSQVYGWTLNKEQKLVPPYKNYPLPDFVIDRVRWLSKQMQIMPMTFAGAILQLTDVSHEERLKKEWEMGASLDWMPITDEYRDWIENSRLADWHKVAVALAFIYWGGDKDEQQD